MQYGICLTEAPCCAAVFRFKDIDSLYAHNTNEEFDYIILGVVSQIRAHAGTMPHGEIVTHRDDVVLIATGDDLSMKDFESSVRDIFQDEKYFYKLFKKHTGLTPSQYRDSLLPVR